MATPPQPGQNPANQSASNPDLSLQVPQAGEANSPVVAPVSPETDTEENSSAKALSPFEIMKKKSVAETSANTPVEDGLEPLSREDLIAQAAKAPTDPFILPTAKVPENTQPEVSIPVTVAQPAPTPENSLPPVVPVAPILPSATTEPPVKPAAQFPVPSPILSDLEAPQVAPASPIPAGPQVKPQPLPMARSQQPRRRSLLLPLMGGLVVAILLLGGGGYVLALNGTRLPFLYKLASGLSENGVTQAQDSSGIVLAKTSYQQSGTIKLSAQDEQGTPVLPTEDNTSIEPVAMFTSTSTADSPLQYNVAEKALVGRQTLTMDYLAEVPLYVNARDEGYDWTFYLPANVIEPLVQTRSEDLKKTLVYPAIYPIPADDLLAAATEETAYQKVSGQKIAEYDYTFNGDSLRQFIPQDASLSELKGTVSYQWETGLPISSSIEGVLSYLGRFYKYEQRFEYGKWDQAVDTSLDSNLSMVIDSNSSTGAVSAESFVPQLGVSIIRIPNTVIDSSLLSDTEPVAPTGQSVSEVSSVISSIPPIPAVPATEEMKQRDLQRRTDLADLQKALQKYKLRRGSYPKTEEGLEQVQASETLFSTLGGTYLTALPVDPLRETYWYEYKSDGFTFSLRSVAEDPTNTEAIPGKAFSYYEIIGN